LPPAGDDLPPHAVRNSTLANAQTTARRISGRAGHPAELSHVQATLPDRLLGGHCRSRRPGPDHSAFGYCYGRSR
jgi:hypothetical protein